MKKITEQNLIDAFGGESQAYMRYMHFSLQAEKEGFQNVGRLFRAIASAEFIHAGDHYKELRHLEGGFVANSMAAFGPGDTKKNLYLSILGESYEIEEMYPSFIEIAKMQNERGAQRSFEWSYFTEIKHKELFIKAKEKVDTGEDMQLGQVQICQVCGYTFEGEAPLKCPVCQVEKEKFKAF